MKWGDIVLLNRSQVQTAHVVDGLDNSPLFAIMSPRDSASGQAQGIAITGRSISGVSSLVLLGGLGDLIQAIRGAADVVVQVSWLQRYGGLEDRPSISLDWSAPRLSQGW